MVVGEDDVRFGFNDAILGGILILKHTLPEINSSHLKIGGWKMNFLLGWPIFRGELFVASMSLVNLWKLCSGQFISMVLCLGITAFTVTSVKQIGCVGPWAIGLGHFVAVKISWVCCHTPFFLSECRLGIHSKIGDALEVHATQLNDLDVAHLRLGLIGEIEGFFCCLNVVFFMIFFPIYPGSTGTVHRYIHHTHVHIKVFFDIQIFVIYIYIHPNTS